MGTHCLVEFSNTSKSYKNPNNSRIIYVHYDGRPERMIKFLNDFINWNKGRFDSEGYAAANFVYYGKRLSEDTDTNIIKDWKTDFDINSSRKIGFGFCSSTSVIKNKIYMDSKYYYKIVYDEKNSKITVESYIIDNETLRLLNTYELKEGKLIATTIMTTNFQCQGKGCAKILDSKEKYIVVDGVPYCKDCTEKIYPDKACW